MKKKFLACMLIMMLTITGCSSKSITQTLFVEKNNKYALCTSEGDLKTKFIYSSYKKNLMHKILRKEVISPHFKVRLII